MLELVTATLQPIVVIPIQERFEFLSRAPVPVQFQCSEVASHG